MIELILRAIAVLLFLGVAYHGDMQPALPAPAAPAVVPLVAPAATTTPTAPPWPTTIVCPTPAASSARVTQCVA
jgi:hypothetical protein